MEFYMKSCNKLIGMSNLFKNFVKTEEYILRKFHTVAGTVTTVV